MRVRGSTASGPQIPRNTYVGLPGTTPSTSQNFLATLRVDHEINDRWLATVHLQKSNQRYRRFFDSYGYDFYGLRRRLAGDIKMWADTALIQNDNWAADLRLDGKFDFLGREHRALFGFESNRRYNRTAFGYEDIGPGNIYTGGFGPRVPGGAANMAFDRDVETVSVNNSPYGQVMFSLTDRAKLLAGARYDIAYQNILANSAVADFRRSSTKR